LGKGFVEYSETVGKILANLQALELLLRRYLYDRSDPPCDPLERQLNDLALGDAVPENPLTDWSTLGQLIDRYNGRVAQLRPSLAVDMGVVAVRDALAHSRVWLPEWSAEPDAPPVLLKFTKPSAGVAKVSFMQVASSAWLETRIRMLNGEIEKVVVAQREL